MAPVLILDVIGLIQYGWGTPLFVKTLFIDQLVLTIVLFILTIIEFKTAKIYDYHELQADDAFAASQNEMEKKLRADALRGLVGKVKGGGFPEEDAEDL